MSIFNRFKKFNRDQLRSYAFFFFQIGVVESTENIYKYHMQLQPNATNSNGSGARTPPQPLVQTPVGAGSQSHSRSSSHSSLQSGKSISVITNTASHPQVKEESSEVKS